MFKTFIIIWFFAMFIPGVYLFYRCLQCFDYEKILKRGQTVQFKIVYFLVCVILSFLFASAFCTVIEKIYEFITNMN
ncbi:MAG: DUF1146 domain-containing protein [Bacilli bacterium]|nr:DUF1146 domain-containing protein [Bacilli bacterium]